MPAWARALTTSIAAAFVAGRASRGSALRAALLVVHRPPPVTTNDEKTRDNVRALGYVR